MPRLWVSRLSVTALVVGMVVGGRMMLADWLGRVPVLRGSRESVPSANGDWPQWHGNPQHTGYQRLPADIQVPAIHWGFRLGGRVEAGRVAFCTPPAPQGVMVLFSGPGRLEARDFSGAVLWTRRLTADLKLAGCWDFSNNGQPEILAFSSQVSGSRLFLFSSLDGEPLWSSEPAEGSAGVIKVADLNSDGRLELLWAPAATPLIRAYCFRPGPEPSVLWETSLREYMSDPSSYSPVAVGDVNGDGAQELVIAGARGWVPVIILDAATGRETARRFYDEHVVGLEAGGPSQLLRLADVDGSGSPEVISISSHGSGCTYMFQGLLVVDPVERTVERILDTFPVGLTYADGSVQDFDADGEIEILVSRFDRDARRHDLLLFDAARLEVEARLDNFFLKGVANTGSDRQLTIIGLINVAQEADPDLGVLAACTYDGTAFVQTPWWPGIGRIAAAPARAYDKPEVENPGAEIPVIDADGDGGAEIPIFRSFPDGRTEFIASDIRDGSVAARYTSERGIRIWLLATHLRKDPEETRILLGGADGTVVMLDGNLRVVSTLSMGGFYRNDAANGHSFEVAAVADLRGSGRPSVVVTDSRNRLLCFEESPETGMPSPPRGRVVWDTGLNQELIAVPSADGGANLLVTRWAGNRPALSMVDGAGSLVWDYLFSGPDGDPPENTIPIGLNLGDFNGDRSLDVIASGGDATVSPRRTYAIDGRTGQAIWVSDSGTYWDAAIAVWDFDQDGFDDAVFSFNDWKGLVLNGRTAQLMTEPLLLPRYGDLGVIDYNGAPMVVGSRPGAEMGMFLIAGDNAHQALLTVREQYAAPGSYRSVLQWVVPQSMPDDERRSMVAAVPLADGRWLAGVGTEEGKLKARDIAEGSTVWEAALWGGRTIPLQLTRRHALSSVIGLDVNRDSRMEFVVGGADGWLYAVDAESGAIVWSIDMGAAVGDPIAADVDNDGLSEILVPTADGYLYKIGPKK